MTGLEKTIRSLDAFAAGGLDDFTYEEQILLALAVNSLTCIIETKPWLRDGLSALLLVIREHRSARASHA